MNIMVQIISEYMHVVDMHVSMLCISILLCITVVGLSLMMEQSQHLLHLLWLLCWWVPFKSNNT